MLVGFVMTHLVELGNQRLVVALGQLLVAITLDALVEGVASFSFLLRES